MSQTKLETWEVLERMGFQPDSGVWSDIKPGLSYDFGNFKLAASAVTNSRFAEIVLFTGVLKTSTTLAEVQFEMPRQIDSEDQCAAWITWNLDNASADEFHPLRPTEWLASGRTNSLLLPWIKDLAAYEARPCCLVDRDWTRIALNKLRLVIENAADNADVYFSFDGEVLTIRCETELIAVGAKGVAWDNSYLLKAVQLRSLPRRLMMGQIAFSVWKEQLQIANWRYEGVITVPLKS